MASDIEAQTLFVCLPHAKLVSSRNHQRQFPANDRSRRKIQTLNAGLRSTLPSKNFSVDPPPALRLCWRPARTPTETEARREQGQTNDSRLSPRLSHPATEQPAS